MQAYLFTGINILNIRSQIAILAQKLEAKILEFPIIKIEDVRNLNNLTRLSFKERTLILCLNIHEAGEEALNAFLKNLEEPQQNIYFALTATTAKKVLPTIVSRCQVIQVIGDQAPSINDRKIGKFFKMTKGEKLSYIDNIHDREAAIEFLENAITFMHQMLHFDGSLRQNALKYGFRMDDVRLALKALSGLKANGNVSLQLTNLVVRMST